MKPIRVLLLICLAFTSLTLTGQTKQLDSVNFWFNQADKLSFENPDSALTCVIKGLRSIEIDSANQTNRFIKLPFYMNSGASFLEFLDRQMAVHSDTTSLANLFLTHQRMRYFVTIEADFDQAFNYCIALRKQLEGNTNHLLYAAILSDVYYVSYWINHVQHDLKKSRDYANKLLKHSTQFNYQSGIFAAKLGMAELTQHEGDIEGGIRQFLALENDILEFNDSILINRMYLQLSNAHVENEDEKTALKYGYLGYRYIPSGNRSLKSFNTIHIARGHLKLGQADSAISWTLGAMNVAVELGLKKEQKDLHEMLAMAYKEKGNFEKALFHTERKLELEKEQESLLSAANISNLEAELEEQRFTMNIKEKELEIERRDAVISRDQTVKLALFVFLLLTIGIVIVSIRSYTRKKNDAATIRDQRDIVEERNREILDSISYAKRIQAAILPPFKLVKEYLENSFILYKPKDIVAGDFYWIEHKDGKILFAAADCTGHGVPGAMVSVICNNGLNRSVREFGLTDPGEILDKTREIILQEFEKSEDEVRDGMDIALCSLDGRKLRYAGANNPLWIIKKGGDTVVEIRPDKQPIGAYEITNSFTTHEVELAEGDTIYIFSDGYADQFGGEKGKKFKAANFKRLLLSIQNESMERQREITNEAFESWKGSIEQVDDVCLIGVRV